MFSEYASRFLQQSNARLSFAPDQRQRPSSRNSLDRRRQYMQRPGMSNPYQPSASQSRFPFASRLGRGNESQAPLFYSTAEDFPDEDDESEQHDRDVADAWALQRSRQHFGRSNLTESSEADDDGMEKVDIDGQDHDREERGRAPASRDARRATSEPDSMTSSPPGSRGKGKLVDVDLASTINQEPSPSLATISPRIEPEYAPTPFQAFRNARNDQQQSTFIPMDPGDEADLATPRRHSISGESVPPTVILPAQEPPKHDVFWANMFQISLFAMFAAFVLIWFHTSSPTKAHPIGDTIYSALRGSTNMLLWDTMIAIVVALVWLALLRSYVRVFVYIVLLAIPVVLFSFSLYPLINSFRGTYDGRSYQDRAMRWLSPIPAILAAVWTWQVILARHCLAKSISILEFSTKILASSPYLIFLGFATLGLVVGWTWLWMLMFERIFLSGHFSTTGTSRWIIDANSWWLGAFFILQYLWTLGVIAGVQRATTAATVSQWYFHRLAVPQPTSQQVVRASFQHALGALFGTVCLSTFLSLLVRLPLIILPGRISSLVNMCAYWIIPTSLATLTNPLTLTYAAIHSQPLGIAARGLGQLYFVSRTNPSNTMAAPRAYSPQSGTSAIIPYRLSKLLLQATRYIMSFALGMVGWVRTAHHLQIDGAAPGLRGSLYAYIVGLVAGTIGFAVLGAVENVVGAVVDAAVICWASETGGYGEARFCREAGELFGNEDGGGARVGRV